MKKSLSLTLLVCLFLGLIASGCSSTEEPVQPPASVTPQSVPPTSPPDPTAAPTETPAPTPLPGVEVLPLESFNEGNPWLAHDPARSAGLTAIYFNLSKPPFEYVPVRQAFAAAVDKEVLVGIIKKYLSTEITDIRPATSMIPPDILGRDLYGDVGIPFDPVRAKELLTLAGYEGENDFPPVTLLVNVSNKTAPGVHLVMAEEMAEMWRTYLDVEVTVEVVTWATLGERLRSDPPDMFRLGWAADQNDPDHFMSNLFIKGAEYNFGEYYNENFDELVLRAREISDPMERQLLYLEAERIVCETDPAMIPIYHAYYDVSQ